MEAKVARDSYEGMLISRFAGKWEFSGIKEIIIKTASGGYSQSSQLSFIRT